MPKLLFLVSSAREIEMSNGTMYETGFFADEAITPYERFTEAGLDVVVATPDGRSPYPDPYGLEEIFHYPDEDEDFLGTITRTFAHDVDDIRLTLRHLTELGMIASRRVFNRLKEAGMTPVEARELINAAALDTWRNDREFLDSLQEQDLPASVTRADLEADLAAVNEDARSEASRIKHLLDTLPDFVNPANLAEMSDETMATFDAVFVPGGPRPDGGSVRQLGRDPVAGHPAREAGRHFLNVPRPGGSAVRPRQHRRPVAVRRVPDDLLHRRRGGSDPPRQTGNALVLGKHPAQQRGGVRRRAGRLGFARGGGPQPDHRPKSGFGGRGGRRGA